jgi:hypothetical protein
MKMYKIFLFISLVFIINACTENVDLSPEFQIEGYWLVEGDNNFKSQASNATADLYHLFRGENNFYRYSFLKTDDFTKTTTLRPRLDSVRAIYRIEGNSLILPNPSPSITNNIPKSVLVSQTSDELVFTQDVIVTRSLVDGRVLLSRKDNVKYKKVTDPIKIEYFNAYLKKYHP